MTRTAIAADDLVTNKRAAADVLVAGPEGLRRHNEVVEGIAALGTAIADQSALTHEKLDEVVTAVGNVAPGGNAELEGKLDTVATKLDELKSAVDDLATKAARAGIPTDWESVTPVDNADNTGSNCIALYVETAGTVACQFNGGATVQITVAAHSILPGQVTRVLDANTSATGIWALQG